MLLLVLGLAAGGGFVYWQSTQAQATVQTTGTQTMTISPATYVDSVSGPGALAAARERAVAVPAAGTLSDIVAVGARVAEGAVVASLDLVPFERALRDAENALASAQAHVQSVRANQADAANNLSVSIGNAERAVEDAQRTFASAESALALSERLHALGSESMDALRQARSAREGAAAALQAARTNLETLRQSRELRSTTNAQELRNAELNVEQARVTLERAREDLEAATVRAPFAGVVASVPTQEGAFVAANATIATILDDAALTLVAQVDEADVGRVAVGQPARVTVGALPDRVFSGVVSRVAPFARMEQNIPIFDVAITIPNETLELRPGMTAEAVITIREVESTITLPAPALQSVRNRHYVQVQQEDGSFAPHPVELVAMLGQQAVVRTELPAGTSVQVPEAVSRAGAAGQGAQGAGGAGFGGLPMMPGGRSGVMFR